MAIDSKKYDRIHGKDGNNKNEMKAKFDDSMHSVVVDFPDDWPELAAVVYQIGQLEEELDYLRGLISDNKDKTTFPGFGTSGSTCLAGNTTTITTSQANAITTNTKKTGITSEQSKAITTNTAKISFPVCTSNVKGATATITGFEHLYDAKNDLAPNKLKISLQIVSGKTTTNYSTSLTLTQEKG
tara:strand:+ start:1590 stop:2144 length:555 start_codon:yes stop_codon:yes gene_type:complete